MSPHAPHEEPSPELPPGMSALRHDDPAWIGSLRVVGRLAATPTGPVFAALTKTATCLAVQTLEVGPDGECEAPSWFSQAVERRQAVGATCVPRIVESDPTAQPPWLATEFVAGHSLAAYVRRYGPLPEQHLMSLAVGVAEALAALHAAGNIHGDLTPESVILNPSGPVLLPGDLATFATGADVATGAPQDMRDWAHLVVDAAGAATPENASDVTAQDDLPEGLRAIVAEALADTASLRPTAAWATDALLAAAGFTEEERSRQSFAWMVRDLLDLAWSDIDGAGHDPHQWRALASAPPRQPESEASGWFSGQDVPVEEGAPGSADSADGGVDSGSGPARHRPGWRVALVGGGLAVVLTLALGGYLALNGVGGAAEEPDADAGTPETPPTVDPSPADSPDDDPEGQPVQFGSLTLHVPDDWDVDVQTAGVSVPGALEIDTNNPACTEAGIRDTYIAALSECGVIVFYGPERIQGLDQFADEPAVASLAEPLSQDHPAHPLTGEAPPCHPAMEMSETPMTAGQDTDVQSEDFAAVGEHEAHYREWLRPCFGAGQEAGGQQQTYVQRDWYLPEEEVYIVDEWNTDELPAVLADARS
ncbi:hypothetical protein RIF23_02275 [Lipingzhangella sp. LS1_29]|uniref:Serine/threonine protein kinase n=1 Tax=Lipingzhangella rawalii TaxID=2055835 RepID=A0ABU2H1E6_9ACTN|nr:hypothetical protein [Lipingzhangella rawalii]MDS1269118.1 hypothetical protein [Lipingzhangella rawalii]